MMLPVSVVIPTCDRPVALARTLRSLLASTQVPEEFVIVDASSGEATADAVRSVFAGAAPRLTMVKALTKGAAAQRNQGVVLATCDTILFCDDDIICEPDCIERLWRALNADTGLGGVSAAIVNQGYRRPGRVLRGVLALIGAPERDGYAGRVVGPAINFLPRASSEEGVVEAEWLNLTCTLYRRAVLPVPPLDTFFTGYSFGEDMALSLRVARHAALSHVPLARIVHDSHPGAHKADAVNLSRMQFVNRHYIMTRIMGRNGWRDLAQLLVWEALQLAVTAWRQRGGAAFWREARGRASGLCVVAKGRA